MERRRKDESEEEIGNAEAQRSRRFSCLSVFCQVTAMLCGHFISQSLRQIYTRMSYCCQSCRYSASDLRRATM